MSPPLRLTPRAVLGQSPTPGHAQGQSPDRSLAQKVAVGALEIEGGATHDLQGDEGEFISVVILFLHVVPNPWEVGKPITKGGKDTLHSTNSETARCWEGA